MRVLLSTIGSRGDVQPVLALALRLRELGHQALLCAPPDFRDWVTEFGVPFVPIGPEVKPTARVARPTPAELRQRVAETVAVQFDTLTTAARDCDLMVGWGALQLAARSVAELLGIGYHYVNFAPNTLPSPHHAPPPMPGIAVDESADNRARWAADAQRWNDIWLPSVNQHRVAAGLSPVDSLRDYLFTDRPLLAADPVLAPWPRPAELRVVQTGAWLLPDQRPLAAELEAFLRAGEPPVYFGFSSMAMPADLGTAMVTAARAVRRRAIVSEGWAGVRVASAPDVLAIGEVNLTALLPRVAAAVHHGGSGTTTLTALAGVPQVVVPQHYDQPYWAGRVAQLGIGNAHPAGVPSADSLGSALGHVLTPEVTARAKAVAAEIRTDGTLVAARYLTDQAAG